MTRYDCRREQRMVTEMRRNGNSGLSVEVVLLVTEFYVVRKAPIRECIDRIGFTVTILD